MAFVDKGNVDDDDDDDDADDADDDDGDDYGNLDEGEDVS